MLRTLYGEAPPPRAGGDDRGPFGREQRAAYIVLAGDGFSSSTYAIELGTFQYEDITVE
ncbi:hypothetical protein [Streptomyces lavendulae]|uniref:hypothetical protein n=1 Tax=Streptomyces lavendulae TaxID=1914 RepID=UPI0025544078|nr:hypothetical protein [Streptomyces lavendulae]